MNSRCSAKSLNRRPPETPRNNKRKNGSALRSKTHGILKERGAQQFHKGFLHFLFRFVSRQNERRKRILIEVGNIY